MKNKGDTIGFLQSSRVSQSFPPEKKISKIILEKRGENGHRNNVKLNYILLQSNGLPFCYPQLGGTDARAGSSLSPPLTRCKLH